MGNNKLGSKSRTFAVSVTTSAKELVKENPKRTGLYVYNNGSETVFILSAQTKAKTEGFPVLKGETYQNDTTTAAFWIMADSGTQDVRVQEDGD